MKTFTSMNTFEPGHLMIVDSLNLAFRYKHARAVDFAEDYMRTVQSLRKSYKCDKLVIAGDMGSSTYRKAIDSGYKQNRKDKFAEQTPEEKEEFELFFSEVTGILARYTEEGQFPVLRFPGVEADDIAAYIKVKRKKFGIKFIQLISSDRDWDLLIDEYVSRFSYVTRKEVTAENWYDHYDFPKEDYISIKCLMGDSGDNVIGVDKIGPKKAAALVKQYGSTLDIIDALPIDSKYKHIQNLNAFGAEALMRNYQLMDLVTFCEDAIGPENCKHIDEMLGLYL